MPDDGTTDAGHGDGRTGELPDDVVEEATRLTRLAREAVDENEAGARLGRRDDLLAEHGFEARLRERDDVLVLYPEEWLVDGTVDRTRMDDLDRAVEVSLAGPGEAEAWGDVEAHNAALVAEVVDEHGPVHAANARAFADFIGNHYARRVETATSDEVAEFLTEYYPRNAWPTDEQRAVVVESLRRLFAVADAEFPGKK